MILKKHNFHIPVMGIGYTADTPAQIAHLGISSVISIVDDFVIEKMRKFYSTKFEIPFKEISTKVEDFRAKRITAYLNLMDKIVNLNFDEMINNFQKKREELEKYFDLLPDAKNLKEKFSSMIENANINDIKDWLKQTLIKGDIDVNIMTKLDKANTQNGESLPLKYNDAQAALRGFAQSELKSSVVLSAGMNSSLYSYIESFPDFYPNINGEFKKKIILKVSDYRSAKVQGNMLAKKGIWVSEYRIESGLNCGGHAFATQGMLLGPILQEFGENRTKLAQDTFSVLQKGLEEKGLEKLEKIPLMKITVQGGIGTNEEHNFLIKEYNLDGTGWGSPFMLVPEVCHIDTDTLEFLRSSKEEDYFLSNASPLGVLFNNVKNSSQQILLKQMHDEGKYGFPCVKQFLSFNTEYSEKPICVASKQYQTKKIAEIQISDMTEEQKKFEIDILSEKECLCEGLNNSVYDAMDIPRDGKKTAISVCPGPNLAYFNKVSTLKEMVDHIYGRTNLLDGVKRPNLFIKELRMYIDYLVSKINDVQIIGDTKQIGYLKKFKKNLENGINYYNELFDKYETTLKEMKVNAKNELEQLANKLNTVQI